MKDVSHALRTSPIVHANDALLSQVGYHASWTAKRKQSLALRSVFGVRVSIHRAAFYPEDEQ